MNIRDEIQNDYEKIREVNELSFLGEEEGKLINKLREKGVDLISLIAEDGTNLIGHILFCPAVIKTKEKSIDIAALGPMAVLPSYQRKGIGSALIKEGISRCIKAGYGAVAVLGHPELYPKFGFSPSVKYGITCEYDVPEEVFMILELHNDFLNGIKGMVKYHAAFNEM